MGIVKEPEKVILFCGLLYNNTILEKDILAKLESELQCKIIKKTPGSIFNHTDYYNKEMGDVIYRQFVLFDKLISPENIADIKHITNDIEIKYSNNNNRNVNIDPGYISLAKVVLATTKNFYHRLYLKNGIYAEVTLYYKNKKYNTFEWTYPDYKGAEVLEMFQDWRERYKRFRISKG